MVCRYAGIDWASDKHDVLVADETGAEVVAATFAHDEKGLAASCRTLVRLEVGLVAIERPDGLLVERPRSDRAQRGLRGAGYPSTPRRRCRPSTRVNPLGGAIGVGRPFGTTGLRMVSTPLNDLRECDGPFGLITMCVGGDQGQATAIDHRDEQRISLL
jgi:hypothetical protein